MVDLLGNHLGRYIREVAGNPYRQQPEMRRHVGNFISDPSLKPE
jgi:hypothetical protein